MDDNHDETSRPGTAPTFTISEEEFAQATSPPDCQGRINLRCERALQKELEDVAEDVRYPLHSLSEVIRFCCVAGLERLRQWKPAPTLLGAIKAASAMAARDKIQCDAADLLERMDERVGWYIRKKEYDEAVTFVAQIRSYFEGLDEDFWSRFIRQEIDEKFIVWLDTIEDARRADRKA